MKHFGIRLLPSDELTSSFLHAFSHLLHFNPEMLFELEGKQLMYSQLDEFLQNSRRLAVKQASPEVGEVRCNLQFVADEQNLTVMLDLSPYMLVYNYGTKTFPVDSLRAIFRQLLGLLILSHTSQTCFISVYVFSVYLQFPKAIVENERVTLDSLLALTSILMRTITKSQMLYTRGSHKYLLSELVQRILNGEDCTRAMRTLLVVSSFSEAEPNEVLFWTPYWCTFAFITTGGHYGSYLIDEQALADRFFISPLTNRYVFRATLYQNSQKFSVLKDYPFVSQQTAKDKVVCFELDGRPIMLNLFDKIFTYEVVLSRRGREKVEMRKNGRHKSVGYNVPVKAIHQIERVRFQQGWRLDSHLELNLEGSLKTCSCIRFKLGPTDNCMEYSMQEDKTKTYFQITITQMTKNSCEGEEEFELGRVIEKMDNMLVSEFQQTEQSKRYGFSLRKVAPHGENQLRYICAFKNQWGKYLRIRRLCFRLDSAVLGPIFTQFLPELISLLGNKISADVFIKRIEPATRRFQTIDHSEKNLSKIIFTKVTRFQQLIEFKIGFLRFSIQDIRAFIDNLLTRLSNKSGKIAVIPCSVFLYRKDSECNSVQVVAKEWKITFRSMLYKRSFELYFSQLLKARGFLSIKTSLQERHLFRIFSIATEERPLERVVFLKICEKQQSKLEIGYSLQLRNSLVRVLCRSANNVSTKSIDNFGLMAILDSELKLEQTFIVNLLDNYMLIHSILLRNCLRSSLRMNEALECRLRVNDPNRDYETLCEDILNRYYPEESGSKQAKEWFIPVPKELLMSSEVGRIEGDYEVVVEGRVLVFFLFEPRQPIYVCKEGKNVLYKVINLFIDSADAGGTEAADIKVVLEELKEVIRKQEYRQIYSALFTAGATSPSLAFLNSRTDNKLSIQVELTLLCRIIAEKTVKINFAIIKPKIQSILEKFSKYYGEILGRYFQEKRGEYYFQRKQENFNQIILKTSLKNQASFALQIRTSNISSALFAHHVDILNEKMALVFEYYQTLNYTPVTPHPCMTELVDSLAVLVKECSMELQRNCICRVEDISSELKEFDFLKVDQQTLAIDLVDLIDKSEATKIPIYLEKAPMQAKLSLFRLADEYMVVDRVGEGLIHVPYSFTLRLAPQTMEMKYRRRVVFGEEMRQEMERVSRFVRELVEHINCMHLFTKLLNSNELPVDPHELFLSERANSKQNRIYDVEKKKKSSKVAKRFEKKFLEKSRGYDKEKQTEVRRVRLPLISKNILAMHQRMSSKEGLQALHEYQVFLNNSILNIKNAYLFEDVARTDTANQYYILHFEEIEPDKQKTDKKYLLYSIFGVFPEPIHRHIEQSILAHIKEALQQRLFEVECQFLLENPFLILEPEDAFLKSGKKQDKLFTFITPNFQNGSRLFLYLRRNLEFSHFQTEVSGQSEMESELHPQQIENKKMPSMRDVSAAEKHLIPLHQSKLWLFNCNKHYQLGETFGRCLYLLRVELGESRGKAGAFLDQSKLKLDLPEEEDCFEMLNYFTNRRSSSKGKGKSVVSFKLGPYVGNCKFNAIEAALLELLKASFAELYIENYFFNSNESLVGEAIRMSPPNDSLLGWAADFDQLIQSIEGTAFFSVKCDTSMYIFGLEAYFLDWLKEALRRLERYFPKKIVTVPYLIYWETVDKGISCVLTPTLEDFEEEMRMELGVFIKFGCIFYDQFAQMLSPKTPFSRSSEVLKLFPSDEYCSRTAYFHCEMSKKGLSYHSYNIRPWFDSKQKDYLLGLEAWLSEKARLLQFIKNAKEEKKYERVAIDHKIVVNSKRVYELLSECEKEEEPRGLKAKPTSTRLLMDLVFHAFPLRYANGAFMIFSKHCEGIYRALIDNPVDYSTRPEYKGKEKSQLERLGREYLTFLKEKGWVRK